MENKNIFKKYFLMFLTMIMLFPLSLVHATTAESDQSQNPENQTEVIETQEENNDEIEAEKEEVDNSDEIIEEEEKPEDSSQEKEEQDLNDTIEEPTNEPTNEPIDAIEQEKPLEKRSTSNKELISTSTVQTPFANQTHDPDTGVFGINEENILNFNEKLSTNKNTNARYFWEFDGDVYIAIESSHFDNKRNAKVEIFWQTPSGEQIPPITYSERYGPFNEITIGNNEALKTIIHDAQWRVFKFTDILFFGKLYYKVTHDSVGGGHNIGKGEVEFEIPKESVTVEKRWSRKEEQTPVKLQLKRYVDDVDNAAKVGDDIQVLQNNDWKSTIHDLDLYDDFGRKYTYFVDEAEVPDNHHKTIMDYVPLAQNSGTILRVKNTYKQITIKKTADKTKDLRLGDTVTYTYTIENTGDIDIQLDSLVDKILEDGPSKELLEDKIVLAPKEKTTIEMTYEVNKEHLIADKITNEAIVKGSVHENGEKTDSKVEASAKETISVLLNSDLTISKEIYGDDDKTQSFIFNVKGTDENTEHINMTVTILGSGDTTIKDLPLGEYQITEDENWSWRYQLIGVSVNEGKINLHENKEITFENERKNNKWLSGDSFLKNIFNPLTNN